MFINRCFMVILLLAYTSFLPVPALSDSVIRTVEGKVTKVADGDTITVLDSNNEQHRVRLAGIDSAWERGAAMLDSARGQ